MRSINGPDNFPKYRLTCSDEQVQDLPRPEYLPHGQGLAARIKRNCAGKVRLPTLLAIVTVPDSNG